jgi:hypothetical protein
MLFVRQVARQKVDSKPRVVEFLYDMQHRAFDPLVKSFINYMREPWQVGNQTGHNSS